MGSGGGSTRHPVEARDVRWIDDVPAPLLVLDRRGEVRATNRMAAHELQLESERRMVTFTDDGRKELVDAIDSALRAPTGDDVEPATCLVRTDERPPRLLQFRCRALAGSDADVVAHVVDLTDHLRTREILARSSRAVYVLDTKGRVQWGPVGYDGEGNPWTTGNVDISVAQLIHPDDLGMVLDSYATAVRNPGQWFSVETRGESPARPGVWGTITAHLINLCDEPSVSGVVLRIFWDGADEQHVTSLGRTTGTFTSLAAAAPVGIVLADRLGLTVFRNERADELLAGVPADRDLATLLADDDAEHLHRLIDETLHGGPAGSLRARFDLPGGARWLAVEVTARCTDTGKPIGTIITLQDVTAEVEATSQLEAAHERFHHLATHDALTGLANRRRFLEELEETLDGRRSHDDEVLVAFCDLDGFKPVNDELGHHAGDAVLVEVARRLRGAVRTDDLLARFGGDEFVVLAPGGERSLGERLQRLFDQPLEVDGRRVALGISVGLTQARADDDVTSLVSRADRLMYDAKAAGGKRVVVG